MARIRINNRILNSDCRGTEVLGEAGVINLSDTVFEFLNEETAMGSTLARSIDPVEEEEEEEEEEENQNDDENRNIEDNFKFWEKHHQLLQDTVYRTSTLESRIRSITKETVKELQQSGNVCSCGKRFDYGCRKCLMEEVYRRLQNAGYNSAVCKSKWKSSPEIPAGEHTFMDVIDNSNSKKEVRVIIELNFRTEFEMARANEEYNKLIARLPEIFVGKIDRLSSLLKILCACAKKCMKEKKMHMGPWRKHRYMQAKWLRTSERTMSSLPSTSDYSGLLDRPRVSMLNTDMMNGFANLNRPVVEVV